MAHWQLTKWYFWEIFLFQRNYNFWCEHISLENSQLLFHFLLGNYDNMTISSFRALIIFVPGWIRVILLKSWVLHWQKIVIEGNWGFTHTLEFWMTVYKVFFLSFRNIGKYGLYKRLIERLDFIFCDLGICLQCFLVSLTIYLQFLAYAQCKSYHRFLARSWPAICFIAACWWHCCFRSHFNCACG